MSQVEKTTNIYVASGKTLHERTARSRATYLIVYCVQVPTKENIADLPSREEYKLLEAIGAKWEKPYLADSFWRPEAWENVSLE